MKRMIILLMLALFLTGCGTAAIDSEFWEHDAMYRNSSHMKYSMGGYKNSPAGATDQAAAEGWWGIPK